MRNSLNIATEGLLPFRKPIAIATDGLLGEVARPKNYGGYAVYRKAAKRRQEDEARKKRNQNLLILME